MAVRGIVAVQRGRVAEKIRGFIRSFNVFCIGCTVRNIRLRRCGRLFFCFRAFHRFGAFGGCRCRRRCGGLRGQVGRRRTAAQCLHGGNALCRGGHRGHTYTPVR